MDIIKTLVNKILAVIPVDQKTLGYILIGLGVLILIIVIVTIIAKLFTKKSAVNYQSKFEGARLSGPLTSVPQGRPISQNPNPSFNPMASPIRGNFAPKQTFNNQPAPGEFGLSKLKSQVEISTEPALPNLASNVAPQRQTIPNINPSPNLQSTPAFGVQNQGFSSPSFVNTQVKSSPAQPLGSPSSQMFSASNPPAGFTMPAQTQAQVQTQMPVETPKPVNLDPNLLDYIKKTKALGYPNSAIRSELIKVGWNPIDVDQALSTNL